MAAYRLRWTERARELLRAIDDTRVQDKLLDAANELADSPDIRGQPLVGELTGYWSLHWSRYRLVYLIDEKAETVFVVTVGMRHEGKSRDVYELARRLLRQGLLTPPE